MPEVKSRREQYTEATRAALLDTATRMFAEKGYAGTTLADVAATAQVTRGAVYHHFENKQALFRAVFERLESEAMRDSREAYESSDDPVQGAFAAVERFLERSCETVYSEVVWSLGPIALGWHDWRECEEQFAFGLIEKILRDLVDSGRAESVPIEATTHMVFSMLGSAGMVLAEADDADKPRIKAEFVEVMGRFVGGLLAREG